jgi:hypothetical protein
LSQNGQRGSLLVFWPHSVFWTKSLICKDAVNRDSTCQSIFRRLCTAKKIEDFRFPVGRPDDVSARLDVHLSTVPSVRTTCSSRLDARQTGIIITDDVSFRPDPPLYREASVPTCILPDLSEASPNVHQRSISFRFFPSSEYGKIDTSSGRRGFLSGRAHN